MKPQEQKRILLVVTKSNFGGAQRYVFEIAKELRERQYEVAVASGGYTGELIDHLQATDITHLPIKHFDRDINLFKEVLAAFELAKHIRNFDPDVLHLNSSKAGGTGAFMGRVLGVPNIIFTAHGWAHNADRGWLWRKTAALFGWLTGMLAHRVITVSEFDRNTAPTRMVRNKCTVIPTGVQSIEFVPKDMAQKALSLKKADLLHIGTVAELTHNKNILFAIKAIHEFNQQTDSKFHYTVIGGGEDEQMLLSYIKENKIDCVSLVGRMQNARRYLNAFDIFLLPSLKEGMPYALLEAAAAGLPLIASDRGGISEVINNTEAGVLIDPTDATKLQTALETMSDEGVRRSFGEEAFMRSQAFSLERTLSDTISVYDSKTTSPASADSRATD